MSPRFIFLLLTALIFFQVMTQTIGQPKKYRCISERDQRCARTTTPQPEPRRIIIRTQNKRKSPGSRPVIIIRKKPSSDQKPSSSSSSSSKKSFSFAEPGSNPSNPLTKLSTDSFSLLTIPLKFIATLLQPLIAPTAKKHNATFSPLVNVQVPMTFSLVHSAGATAHDPNSLVICNTQCFPANGQRVPCSDRQPCGADYNTPCTTTSGPCGSTDKNVPTPVPGDGVSGSTLSTQAPPTPSSPTPITTTPEPTTNCVPDNSVILLCKLLNEIHRGNYNATVLNCPRLCPPTDNTDVGSTTPCPPTTKGAGPTTPSSGATGSTATPPRIVVTQTVTVPPEIVVTSCAPPTKTTTGDREDCADTSSNDCTPPETVVTCLFAVSRHKAACKPCPPLSTTAFKPKSLLRKPRHAAYPLRRTHPRLLLPLK